MKKLFLVWAAALGLHAFSVGTPVPDSVDMRAKADISIELHWQQPENMTPEQKSAWENAIKKAQDQIRICNESDKTGNYSSCSSKVIADLALEIANLFENNENVMSHIGVNPKDNVQK